MTLSGWLWILLIVLLVAWLIGFTVGNLGPVVHVLLVLALIVLLYNLLVAGHPAL